jgi:hypothetical protein
VHKVIRKIVVRGDHIEPTDNGPPWTVLWETRVRSNGQWSTARAGNRAAAFEQAVHFVKLGFVVDAVKDPSGIVVLNADAIARLVATNTASPIHIPEPTASTAERFAREILQDFIEDHKATPGRMLAASALSAPLARHGMSADEFKRAVSYAENRGWLSVVDSLLKLTQAGYAAATG